MSAFLDKIQSLFSKWFVIASFLPVFIVTFINATIANETVPRFHAWVLAQKPQSNLETIIDGGVALFAIGVVAFLLSSLTTFQRELLEGKHWHPPRLQEFFVRMQEAERTRMEKAFEDARRRRRPIRRNATPWREALSVAHDQGTQTAGYDPKAIDDLLAAAVKAGREVASKQLEDIYTPLRLALATYKADDPANERLDEQQQEFVQLVDDALQHREYEYIAAYHVLQYSFGKGRHTAATAIGNIAAAASSYSYTRYAISFDLFWMRMQHAAQSDSYYSVLQDAKAQLDALITLFWLLAITTVIWSAALAVCTPAFWWFLGVAIGGPLLCRGVYFLALNSYRGLAEVMRSVVDLYRFKVLKNLHIRLPTDLKSERELWDRLDGFIGYGDEISLAFEHSA